MVVVPRTKIEADTGSVIRRRTVVIRRCRISRDGITGTRRRVGVGLVHVKIDALRDMVFGREQMARPKYASLNVLIRGDRECANDVIVRTEIVERTVFIAKYFQVQRRVSDDLAVGFDPSSWREGFNGDIVGDRSMRSWFCARRN